MYLNKQLRKWSTLPKPVNKIYSIISNPGSDFNIRVTDIQEYTNPDFSFI
jgi:hypothetical protein